MGSGAKLPRWARGGKAAALACGVALALSPAADGQSALWLAPLAASAPAAAGPPSGLPPDEVLEARGAVVGEISIRVEDVFDTTLPEEDRALYGLANRLHLDTRPEVVRRQLLFASGDPYSVRLLRESERLLRGRDYLFDCAIRPVAYRDNRVDVEVWVKDVWTIKPGVSFGRGGGANDWRLQLDDRNLLGSGKRVSLDWEETVDRTSVGAQYIDGSVLGTRLELEALYADNSDGRNVKLELVRPFFSFDTRWAAGVHFVADDRVDTLYALGERVDRYFHRQEELEVFGGVSRGLRGAGARRWTAGVTYQRDRYADAPGHAPAASPPTDGERIYPWLAVEQVSDAFVTARNQDQLGRTEDVLLGGRHRLRLGFAAEAMGSDRDRLVLRASSERGLRPLPRLTLLTTVAVQGRWGGGDVDDFLAVAEGRFYLRNLGRHLFFADVQLAAARDLDGRKPPRVHRVGGDRRPHVQLLLGGDSGLRGYPLRYQDGEGRALVTLEQRFFTDFYPLRLAFVGAAVFVDIGRTWPGEASGPNLGWLADVGFGLRLSSSRSGFGTVVHLDAAFPLERDGSIDGVQLLVTSKQSL